MATALYTWPWTATPPAWVAILSASSPLSQLLPFCSNAGPMLTAVITTTTGLAALLLYMLLFDHPDFKLQFDVKSSFLSHQSSSRRCIQRSPRHNELADFKRESFWQHKRVPANGLWPPGCEGTVQKHHPAHKPHHPAMPGCQDHHQAQAQLPGKHPRETGGLRLAAQIVTSTWRRCV